MALEWMFDMSFLVPSLETAATALRSARAAQLGLIHHGGDEKSDIAERCYNLEMQLLYSISFAASSANIFAT